jgi:hypothetical protein
MAVAIRFSRFKTMRRLSGQKGGVMALVAAIGASLSIHFVIAGLLVMATTAVPLLWFLMPLTFFASSAVGTAIFRRLRPTITSDSTVWLFVLLLLVLLISSIAVANLVVTGIEF